MIISHKHKFIFVHLGRTGGRSLTIELAKHCGPDDIITATGSYLGQHQGRWHRHAGAPAIRDAIGIECWNDYFTFAVERNPWDKVVSNYWAYKGYRHGEGGATEQIGLAERIWRKASGYPWSLDGWLKYRLYRGYLPGFRFIMPSEFGKYTDESGNLLVDSVYRYEHRDQHLEMLSERLGLSLASNAREGRNTRQNRRDYTESYTDWSRDLVGHYFHREIDLLHYGFGQPAPADAFTKQQTNGSPAIDGSQGRSESRRAA